MAKLLVQALTLAVIAGLTATAVPAQTPLKPEREIEAKGFKTSKKGELKAAYDLSGIACLPPSRSEKRACLVINDQDKFAQLATYEDGKLKAGEIVPLLDEELESEILGSKPKNLSCSGGKTEFKDLDGEGVAYQAPYFYVVGSHGCSRKHREAVPSAFVLTRIRVDQDGAPRGKGTEAVEATFRLSDVLRRASGVGDHFGRDLNEADGLNVEGIAVVEDKIFVGLRAPSIDHKAFLVGARINDLFAPGNKRSQAAADLVPLELGENVGIRDLAVLASGRLLVLTGPTREQANVPFRLYTIEPRVGGTLTPLAILEDVEDEDGSRAKAEAVLPLDGAGQRVLVLFDGLKNGGPREYVLQ